MNYSEWRTLFLHNFKLQCQSHYVKSLQNVLKDWCYMQSDQLLITFYLKWSIEEKEIIKTSGLYYKVLAILCDLCWSQISVLFLRAAASELMPTILCRIWRGRLFLDDDVFSWIECLQSFMNISDSDSYICEELNNKVQRVNVWCLLYLSSVIKDNLYYNSHSFTP